MSVLDVLLEGFDAGKHPRGAHGRWIRALNAIDPNSRHFADVGGVAVRRGGAGGRLFVTKRYSGADRTPHETHHGSAEDAARYIEQSQQKPATKPLSSAVTDIQRAQALRGGAKHVPGDKVHVVTPQGHVLNGTVHQGAQTYDVITSRGTERSTTIEVHWADGDVTHERPQDVQAGHRAIARDAQIAGAQRLATSRRDDARAAQITAARALKPSQPFSRTVRTALPQGENPATKPQQRQLGRVLRDIQMHTRDYTEAQRVLRFHLARAGVKSAPALSSREFSLMLKDLEGLAKHGPSALESEPAVLDALLSERFVSQAERSKAAVKGHAMHVDGRDIFPIESAKDAQNALTLWRSGHHKTAAARAHILRNARRVGATSVVAELSGGG